MGIFDIFRRKPKPEDVPDLSKSGVIGLTTGGEPVFEPPAKTVGELAERIDRPSGGGGGGDPSITITSRAGISAAEQARLITQQEAQRRAEELAAQREVEALARAEERRQKIIRIKGEEGDEEEVVIKPPIPEGEKVKLKRPLFTFGEERPSSVITRGLPPIVTEKEAKKLRAGGVPEVFLVPSAKTPAEAIEEGALLGSIGLRRAVSPTLETKGTTLFNIQQVKIAEETVKRVTDIKKVLDFDPLLFTGRKGVTFRETDLGKEIILGEKFFKKEFEGILDITKQRARESYKELPLKERAKLFGGGLAVGGAQAFIGLGELAGTLTLGLGVQTFTKQQEGDLIRDASLKERIFGRTFKFGRTLGEIRTMPKTEAEIIGQVGVALPLVYLGGVRTISTFRELGFKKGLIETAGYFTPLRIPPQVFVPDISKQEFLATSLKQKKGEEIVRIISGKGVDDPLITFHSRQVSKILKSGEVSMGTVTTRISTPAFRWRAGELLKGTRVIETRGIGMGVGAEGKILLDIGSFQRILAKDLMGFGGKALIQTKGDIVFFPEGTGVRGFGKVSFPSTKFTIFKGGGVTAKKDLFTLFQAGRRTPISDLDITDTGWIVSPTGRFRVTPKIKGIEFDLDKLLGLRKEGFTILGRGTTKTSLMKTFGDLQLQEQLTSISAGLSTQVSSGSSLVSKASTGLLGVGGLTPRPKPRPKLDITTRLDTKIFQDTKQDLKLLSDITQSQTQLTKQLQKEKQIVSQVSLSKTMQRLEQPLRQVQPQKQRLRQRQKLRQQLKLKQTFRFDIPTLRRGFDIPISFMTPPPIILFPGLKGKKFKKKREKLWGKEDIALAESFTAKQLGLEPIKLTEKQVRRMAKLPSAGLRLQRAPIIIR